jgi:L-threonate 2-dehydrogenase
MAKKVAVLGLGSMGLGMAKSLLRGGFDVVGYDISDVAVARFQSGGGSVARSPSDAASGAQAVVCVVINAAQTEDVLFGSGRVGSAMSPGSVFLACATMLPDNVRRMSARLEEGGVHYLDAPISGGSARAEQGQLTVMASGSSAAFAAAKEFLGAMAAKVYQLGDKAGSGAAFKMINQHLAGIHIAAAGEAMALAAKQGLDLKKVYEVITASAGNSWMFENRVPHILAGDYTPHSSVEIFVKDMGIVQDMARAARYPAPLAAAALQMYLAAAGAGLGEQDDAAVAKVYAQLSGAVLPGME